MFNGKRLRKSSDKKIFGVCGGIAEYFNIDPFWVRLLWGIAVLFYGVGIWLYFLLALIMPKDD